MKALTKILRNTLKIPNRGLEWLIFHNLYIALGAVALTTTTYFLLKVPTTQINWALLIFIFCATIFTYNIDRVPFYFDHWFPTSLQLAATLGMAVCCFWFSWSLLFFLVHLGFIAVLYSIPRGLGWLSWFSLRRIPLLKIFLVAYGWAAVTVILPALTLPIDWQTSLILYMFGERFLFTFIITIPFDIGDFENDKRKGIITLPVWLGIKSTRWLGYFLIAVYWLGAFWYTQQLVFSLMAGMLMLSCVIFLIQVNTHTPRMYYKKYVDGAMFLYFAIFSFI